MPKPSKKTQNQLSPNQTAAWLNNASDRGTDHISQINPTFLLGMRGNVGLNGLGPAAFGAQRCQVISFDPPAA